MLFSDSTKRSFVDRAIAHAAPPDGIRTLRELQTSVEAEIAFDAVTPRVAYLPTHGKQVEEIASEIDRSGDESVIVIDCLGEKVDMAKRCPGRMRLNSIVDCFESRGWIVADAVVDNAGLTICVGFVPGGQASAHQGSRFIYDGAFVSLRFAAPADIMRKKSVLSGAFYERYMLENIAGHYFGGDIVDVGANVGNHTVFFGLLVGKNDAKVHSIEPGPTALGLLRCNIEANNLEDVVSVYECAAGDAPGHVFLRPGSAGNLGAVRVASKNAGGQIEAPIAKLDDMIPPDRDVAVIKMDVEGYEVPALRGASQLVSRCKPYIYAEAGTAEAKDQILAVLQPWGYEQRGVFNDTPTYWFVHPDCPTKK